MIDRKNLQNGGFVHFHKRRDGWNTLHELAVDKNYHKQGIGKALFSCVPTPIRLKTTVDNFHAMAFYTFNGMTHIRTDAGKKRPLAVFESLVGQEYQQVNEPSF